MGKPRGWFCYFVFSYSMVRDWRRPYCRYLLLMTTYNFMVASNTGDLLTANQHRIDG